MGWRAGWMPLPASYAGLHPRLGWPGFLGAVVAFLGAVGTFFGTVAAFLGAVAAFLGAVATFLGAVGTLAHTGAHRY